MLKCVNKILVFRMFLSENCNTLCWRWLCSFQLERTIPNYINRKIEKFERLLVMQNTLVPF